MYKILEDRSPYYIKFTYAGIDSTVERSKEVLDKLRRTGNFTHHKLTADRAADLLQYVPFAEQFRLNVKRVSFFISAPRYQHYAHIDGSKNYISLNLGVGVHDNLCTTNYYDKDLILKNYKTYRNVPYDDPKTVGTVNRIVHRPLMNTVVEQGVFVLHNASIFHDWDNSESDNERAVLTFRPLSPETLTFEQAKKLLFLFQAVLTF